MQILTFLLLSALPALSSASPMKQPAPTYASAAITPSSTSHTSIPPTPTPSGYPSPPPKPTQRYIDPLLLEFADTVPTAEDQRSELKARAPYPAANPSPQQTCANSGSGNSGCANSGINNSGTSNSGINNCGTDLSGVGEGCSASSGAVFVAASQTIVGAGAYTATLTGPTSTVTIVLDSQHRRSDCAYWKTQGYICSGAAGVRAGLGVLAAAVAVGGWVLVM